MAENSCFLAVLHKVLFFPSIQQNADLAILKQANLNKATVAGLQSMACM